jgi:cell division protein FtsL
MRELTGTTWVIIIIFVAFVILINVWLFLFAKDKNTKQGIKILSDSIKVLKNPFKDEDKKLEELSSLTDKFKETADSTKKESSGVKNA